MCDPIGCDDGYEGVLNILDFGLFCQKEEVS
jgi:hypothetical protein